MMLRIMTVVLFTVISIHRSLAQTDDIGAGQALYFDGVDDYVDLGDIFDNITYPFSVTAWVYIDPSHTGQCPILTSQDDDRLYNGFWFGISQTTMWLGCGDGRGENHKALRWGKKATIPNTSGRWVHAAAVVYGERNIGLYLNGIALTTEDDGESTRPMHTASPGIAAVVGRSVSNGTAFFHHGAIDDVRVYSTALSAAQLQQLMCRKPQGSDIPQLGYWSFDETTGTEAKDRSGKNQHATIQGARHDFSNAPLGDLSVSMYPAVSGAALVLNAGDHTIQARTGANAEGLHIYQVNHAPSQTGGIAASGLQDTYFGVFVASVTTPRPFEVANTSSSNACSFFTRPGNATATWATRADLLGLTDRVEFIYGGGGSILSIELGADVEVCNGNYYDLSVQLPNTETPTVLWNTGESTPAIRVTRSGKYRVEVQGECNSARDSIRVTFATSPPAFSLGSDSTSCVFKPRQLKPSVDLAGLEIHWQDGSQEPSLQVTDFGSYWVQLSNACGTASDTIHFSRADLAGYALPNVITPGNNDDLNQTFKVHDLLQGSPFSVFNRWGREVYATPAYYNEWDGADLAGGVYYYRLVSPCIGERRGTVSILR